MIPRLLLFIALTGALVLAGTWLADHPGQITIHWLGWRVESSVAALLGLIIMLLTSLGLLWALIAGLWRLPVRLWQHWREARTRRGYRALADGFSALALGDGPLARKMARRVESLLPDPRLAALLTAQAAQLTGQEAEQEQALLRLADQPDSAAVGLKGLVELALRNNDREKALLYARRAWDHAVSGPSLTLTLLDLLVEKQLWDDARQVAEQARKRRDIPRDQLSCRQAVIWCHLGEQAEQQGQIDPALSLARQAVRADPAYASAACLQARLLHRLNKPRKAEATLTEGWRYRPDAKLAEAWFALAPAETPLQRVERLSRLIRSNPRADESHQLLGEAALNAKLWGQARTHLLKAAEHSSNPALLSALARLEREEA